MYTCYFDQWRMAIPLLLEAYDIPGLSLCVTNRNEVLFSEGFGFTDPSCSTRVTEETRFSLQSISKKYTAFGFMLAVGRGDIELDDPVIQYVPSLRFKHRDGEDYAAHITFRHLLTHRSGLAMEAPIGNNFAYGDFEEHIQSINDTYLRCRPGEEYSYSNVGIDLAAYVLGKVNDRSFEEYMDHSVFAPLGMDRSTFKQEVFLNDPYAAVGHGQGPVVKQPVPMIGGGGMYSCVADMAKFIQCFLGQGSYQGHEILDASLVRAMYSEYPASETWPYNIGMVAGIIKGRTIVNHNGGGYGFSASQDILPEEGLGAAVLTNTVQNSDVRVKLIRSLWFDLLSIKDHGATDGKPLPEQLQNYTGVYQVRWIDGQSKAAIIPRNGELYWGFQKLEQHSHNVFFTANADVIEWEDDDCLTMNNIKYRKLTSHANMECHRSAP